MASVSSLDQDMRRLRLDRYTPQAASELRDWIEATLGEQLAPGDVLEALKDGVALCKLANLALPPPGIKFKTSSMPFVQRENIAQFLAVCERPPLNMPSHDRFLTVDLFDGKDPAQVLQCVQAFSRAAHGVNPARFPHVIGPRGQRPPSPVKKPADWTGKAGVSHVRGPSVEANRSPPVARTLSPTFSGASSSSSQQAISSWKNKDDQANTAPAWNIHQYGYMGGANQGSQGINFGAPRQITSAAPHVPSLAEKEKLRKEKAEQERLEVEERRRQEEAEEKRAKEEEQRRWEEETLKAREAERAEVERQKRKWEEEERRWREEEEARKREEEQLAASTAASTTPAANSTLHGQYLSDYQHSQSKSPRSPREISAQQQSENDRIRELERQLEEAREREKNYLAEREKTREPVVPRGGAITPTQQPRQISLATDTTGDESLVSEPSMVSDVSILSEPEGGILSSPRGPSILSEDGPTTPRPLPTPVPKALFESPPVKPLSSSPTRSSRPSPFTRPFSASPSQQQLQPSPLPSRPLPSPAANRSPFANRTDAFLQSNPAPVAAQPTINVPAEAAGSSTEEQDAEDARRKARQTQTKAGGWASKNLLEREMERERERQREWEEQQMAKNGGTSRIMGPRAMNGR